MRKQLIPGIVVVGVILSAVSGCAGANTSSPGATTQTQAPSSQTQVPSAEPSPDLAATACEALGDPASLSYNAWNDLQKGTIDLETSIEQLEQADVLFRAIDAPPGGIAIAVSNVLAYIDAAVPGPEGQPYDTGTSEFFNLTAGLASACTAAGQDLILNAHGG